MPHLEEAGAGPVAAVLGRPAWSPLELPTPAFNTAERVLITGSAGFLGRRLTEHPAIRDLIIGAFDLVDGTDILDEAAVRDVFGKLDPTIVFHLAAHKEAPAGEALPGDVADLNVRGTGIVAEAAAEVSRRTQRVCRVVLASTCKAADAATAYGASKLIAERIVLNIHGGVAMRLVNVAGSSRSVLQEWELRAAEGQPLRVATDCERAFVTPDEAVRLLLNGAQLPAGVYAPRATFVRMGDVAARAYPDSRRVPIAPRWGDRLVERTVGDSEWAQATNIPAIVAIRPEWAEGADRYAIAAA